MAVVTPTTGAARMLEHVMGISSAGTKKLRLYGNNYTPVGGSQSTHFTESTGAGYSAESMTASTWTISTTGSGIAIGSATARTFTYTSGDTVYGYYVTSTGTTYLYFAEKFTDGPYTIPAGGGTVTITPDYDLKSSTS